jgi:hypothetical protein
MGSLVDESCVPGDRNGDVVRKELGHIETLEAVNTDILMVAEVLVQMSLQGYHLSSQSVSTILDCPGGTEKVPGQSPDTHRTAQKLMELRIRDQLLGPVIDAERLSGEPPATSPALESGHLAKGISAVVPGPGPPERILGFQVVNTVLVGAEGRNQLLAPVDFVCFHTLPYASRISGACAVGDFFRKTNSW